MSNISIPLNFHNHSITVIAESQKIIEIGFDINIPDCPDELCLDAKEQFIAYFEGRLQKFNLPYDIDRLGTPFFRNILHAIENIPYGKTVSYKDIAIAAGTFAVRAAGSALKKNPLPILIPCHRIICSDGSLGHYMGGSGDDIKQHFLNLEGVRFDENKRIIR